MKFSGKIEDGTSNEPLNFGNDLWPWRRSTLSECFSSYYYCDALRTAEELPEPSSSSPTANHRPAIHVNQFSWRSNAKTDKHFHDKRQKFVNSGKYSNRASSFPTQQVPLVSQEHLQAVVRKVARGDRFKGKNQQHFIIKTHSHNGQELMTSSSHSRQKAEGGNRRNSIYSNHREVVTDKSTSIYQFKSSMYSVKPSGDRKEQKESQFEWAARSPPQQTHDVMDDDIKGGAGRLVNVNKLVARERHTASEHSSSLIREDHNSSITMNKHFFIRLAFIFLMVINVIRSGLSINSLKRKWVIGLSTLACGNGERLETADSPPDSFGGKRSWAYIRSYTNVSASWMNDFDRYIKNLDSEYGIMSSYKLAYSLYIYVLLFLRGWHGSVQPCQARLQPWLAIYCIHWSISYQNGVIQK